MKKLVLLIVLFAGIQGLVHSQKAQWTAYEFDDLVDVTFPVDEIYELDTTIQGINMVQRYSQYNNSTFLVQKSEIDQNSKNRILKGLPYDKQSLLEYYDNVVIGMAGTIENSTVEQKELSRDNLIGLRAILSDSINSISYESELFVLENDIYIFSIYHLDSLYPELSKTFFNSISIKNPETISQFKGKSEGYKQGYLMGKIFFSVLFGIGIFVFIKSRFRKK